MTEKKSSFDPQCLELAEYFLRDEPSLRDRADELAQQIQDAIEDWIEAEKQELEGAE